MEKRNIGKSGLSAPFLGMGTWAIGGGSWWGDNDDALSVKAILTAVEQGITWVDTAPIYGLYHSEEVVGEALKHLDRDKIILSTKCGLEWRHESPVLHKVVDGVQVYRDLSEKSILEDVEESLKRLGTDHIDLYYQHRIDPAVPIEDVAGVMAELIQEGKITHWGLSEAYEETIRRAHAVCPVTAVQNRYSMMARWYEELFPVLEELHIGYVAFSPLANGFLSAKYGKDAKFDGVYDYRSMMPQFTSEAVDKNKELLTLLHRMAEEKESTPAQISLAWILCRKPYLVPIPGSRKEERLKENAGAADIILTASEMTALDEALETMEMSDVFGGSKIKKR